MNTSHEQKIKEAASDYASEYDDSRAYNIARNAFIAGAKHSSTVGLDLAKLKESLNNALQNETKESLVEFFEQILKPIDKGSRGGISMEIWE
jgi:hypothetical protein